MKVRTLALWVHYILFLALVITSCAPSRLNMWRSNRDYEQVLHAARKAAIEAGFTVTSIDFDNGFMVAELDVTTGLIFKNTSTCRMNIYLKRVDSGIEIEVAMDNPEVFFKKFKKALTGRLPDAVIVSSK